MRIVRIPHWRSEKNFFVSVTWINFVLNTAIFLAKNNFRFRTDVYSYIGASNEVHFELLPKLTRMTFKKIFILIYINIFFENGILFNIKLN